MKTANDVFREQLIKVEKKELVELLIKFLSLDMQTSITFGNSYKKVVADVASLTLSKLTGNDVSPEMINQYVNEGE